jgi:hypothetical protein
VEFVVGGVTVEVDVLAEDFVVAGVALAVEVFVTDCPVVPVPGFGVAIGAALVAVVFVDMLV